MEQILPGLWHWTRIHPGIHMRVSSWFLEDGALAIDPLMPDEGVDWFADHGGVEEVVLTNRHHYRQSGELERRYGATVRCQRAGMHEFTHGEHVEPFEFGAVFGGGAEAFEIGAITPEEIALHLPVQRAVAIADGIVLWHEGADLGFVPDFLLGDDPEAVKRGLRAAYKRLLAERAFDHLLLAHGGPLLGDGRQRLIRFLEGE
jgi:hypothetical protein